MLDFDVLIFFPQGDDEEEEEEDEAKKKEAEERVAQYYAKKSTKPAVIAKSNIILDVKPWDDETDMAEVEKAVRSVVKDGLVWGACKYKQGSYGSWKSWKLIEFYLNIFQALKIMENLCFH